MTFIRLYSLVAKDNQDEALLAALADLRAALGSIDGSERLLMCLDREGKGLYTVMEFWRSAEDHEASATKIPKACFRAIMDQLAQPPGVKDINTLD